MKQLYVAVLALTVLLSGCYKNDIRDLRNDIETLQEQMARYEALLNALDKRLYITGYEKVGNQYQVTLSDGSILNAGASPVLITISSTSTWLIDGVDTKVAVENIAVLTAPALTIDSSGNWLIGGKATGVKANTTIDATARSIIAIVQHNEYMIFVFSNGQTIQLKTLAPQVKITVPDGGFVYNKFQWVRITPTVDYGENASYAWTIGSDTIGTAKELLHVFDSAATYLVKFSARNSIGTGSADISIKVNDKTYTNGVTRVFEFVPAPGQFVNKLPVWADGENTEAVRVKAETALKANSLVHLGAFGGKIVMGFDHTIVNKSGNASFIVNGNAFANWSEPGIIEVSYDANGNCLPDDAWYEIAGSEYNSAKTIKNYSITYYKPDENKVKTPSKTNASLTDTTYIKWKDNQGQTGFVNKNSFHSQSYYPQWLGDSVTFNGTKLTNENVKDLSGRGTNYVSPAFDFGYADNWANTAEKAKINIDWAVDKTTGKTVKLKGVDFIKVYTGMLGDGGWLGEISTEISGVKDLNIK